MFPTASSTIYRNAEGEVIGWDTPAMDEAPDADRFYDDAEADDDAYYFDTLAECEAAGVHGDDGYRRTPESPWMCGRCDHPFVMADDEPYVM